MERSCFESEKELTLICFFSFLEEKNSSTFHKSPAVCFPLLKGKTKDGYFLYSPGKFLFLILITDALHFAQLKCEICINGLKLSPGMNSDEIL